MAKQVVLKEWFDRVDSSKTGNITAPQLQNALAVGNLHLPLSVVQQMIRGRGFLIHDDVYEALVKLGYTLDSPAFYTACESFDQKKNGEFRLDSFMSLCTFVQSALNLFNSFDTSKQGRVTLDLNQFIYCTANCRI